MYFRRHLICPTAYYTVRWNFKNVAHFSLIADTRKLEVEFWNFWIIYEKWIRFANKSKKKSEQFSKKSRKFKTKVVVKSLALKSNNQRSAITSLAVVRFTESNSSTTKFIPFCSIQNCFYSYFRLPFSLSFAKHAKPIGHFSEIIYLNHRQVQSARNRKIKHFYSYLRTYSKQWSSNDNYDEQDCNGRRPIC